MRAPVALLLVGLVGACSKSAPPPGKLVALSDLCNEADKTRVRISGHLRYRRGLLSFCSSFGGKKTCDLALYADATKPADFNVMRPQKGPEPLHAKISVPVGDDPGTMNDLPKKFTDTDVVLHLPNNAQATEGTRVTIDGTVSIVPAGGSAPKSCYVNVEWASPG
jgi:hypothetical protein